MVRKKSSAKKKKVAKRNQKKEPECDCELGWYEEEHSGGFHPMLGVFGGSLRMLVVQRSNHSRVLTLVEKADGFNSSYGDRLRIHKYCPQCGRKIDILKELKESTEKAVEVVVNNIKERDVRREELRKKGFCGCDETD